MLQPKPNQPVRVIRAYGGFRVGHIIPAMAPNQIDILEKRGFIERVEGEPALVQPTKASRGKALRRPGYETRNA